MKFFEGFLDWVERELGMHTVAPTDKSGWTVKPGHRHASPPLAPGQKWSLTDTEPSPWGSKPSFPVVILDATDGWVRYYMSPMFPDNRMKEDMFTHLYGFLSSE